ncbi:hypothetical protein [Pseudoclavibacter helvolus]|uniref:hypothetical protein n=1 Tax=Pseudoclavibacter helvolus TaxID=255205 RepID=UPI0008395B91|nr:hypothetical protein [Pseudoclavibacter helvolus]
MSTINPLDLVVQRDAARAARVGSGRALAVLLLTDFGLAAGGFLGAVGLSSLFFIARIEETSTFPLVALLPLLIPVGIFMSVGFLIAQAFARRAYTGAPDFTRALADGQPIWFAGAAVGAWGSLAALLLLTTITWGPLMSNGDGPPVVEETPGRSRCCPGCSPRCSRWASRWRSGGASPAPTAAAVPRPGSRRPSRPAREQPDS